MNPAVTVEEAYRQCAAVSDAHAANFRHAFVFMDRDRRRAIEAVYAFSRRADDLSDGTAPVGEKRAALRDLRARLHAPPPDDPVLVAVADAVRRYGIPLEPFDHLLDGVTQDLDVTRYATFAELSEYCTRVASTIGLICIEIFGHDGPASIGPARDLGIAMQLTNIIRDVKEDAARDRVYLPREDLDRFGVREEELTAGTASPQAEALIRFQAVRARDYFARGRALRPHLRRLSRPCPAILAAIYERVLDRIEEDPLRVLRERVSLPSGEKKWVVVRAMVGALLS